MFFFIPFSLIYINRNAVTITELTYQRTENNKTSYFTVITKTFENQSMSNLIVYPGEKNTEPSLIYSVYRRNNLLIINNELFELNRPGFCRDGEDRNGKFEMCIKEIIPSITINPLFHLTQFLFSRKCMISGSIAQHGCYISSPANLLVKKEKRDTLGNVISRGGAVQCGEEIIP
ncbi:MAG: hypothetical protein WDN75_18180 [Bacteroidota bacterium]